MILSKSESKVIVQMLAALKSAEGAQNYVQRRFSLMLFSGISEEKEVLRNTAGKFVEFEIDL